jgi:hypothetical protein
VTGAALIADPAALEIAQAFGTPVDRLHDGAVGRSTADADDHGLSILALG